MTGTRGGKAGTRRADPPVLFLGLVCVFVCVLVTGAAGGLRAAAAGGCVAPREPPTAPPPTVVPPTTTPPPSGARPQPRTPATNPRSSPTTPGGAASTPSTGRGAGRGGTVPAAGAGARSTWRTWWAVNDRALLPERVFDGDVTTPGQDDEALARGRLVRRDLSIEQEILPVLRGVLEDGAPASDLLRRTALLALGKLARTASDAALLVHWLEAPTASLPEREAAALAIGLLRRSDAGRALDPATLDALRLRLLRTIDETDVPDTVRATCALSLGLLSDQPYGSGIHRDGRLVTHGLWQRLQKPFSRSDVPVGLLTALGRQPPAGVPAGILEALRDVVTGRPALDRRWSDVERSHALVALARLDGPRAWPETRNALLSRQAPVELERAALIALTRMAGGLDAETRAAAAEVLESSLRGACDPLTRGLASIASGQLVSAQLGARERLVHDLAGLWRRLLLDARSATGSDLGFARIALGLATRSAAGEQGTTPERARARDDAEPVLLEGLVEARSDAEARGACAIALGLMRSTRAVRLLVERLEDADESASVRADAAVALGQIGHAGPEVVRALHLALADALRPDVQAGAALGLSLLSGYGATTRLVRELEQASTTEAVRRLTEPLGHLADPAAVRPLVEYAASPGNADLPRAHVLVALGNLGDAEPRPSLAALGQDANYPAAPDSLLDVLFTR